MSARTITAYCVCFPINAIKSRGQQSKFSAQNARFGRRPLQHPETWTSGFLVRVRFFAERGKWRVLLICVISFRTCLFWARPLSRNGNSTRERTFNINNSCCYTLSVFCCLICISRWEILIYIISVGQLLFCRSLLLDGLIDLLEPRCHLWNNVVVLDWFCSKKERRN
jgi:hypothetical protein